MSPRLAFIRCLVLVAMSLCASVAAAADHVSGWFTGEGTQYTLSNPSNGNCNFMAFPQDAPTKYAALNGAQFQSRANCGRCAEVSCVDAAKCAASRHQTETVYIVDQCPECKHGDLDLSPDVFKTITGHASDRVAIQWKFVDCPIAAPQKLQFCLKPGSNPFWTAIQPANFAVGVQSMAINGEPTTMVDSAFYFVRDGKSASRADLSALQLTLTSVTGQVITETVSLANGGCVDSKFQFTTSLTMTEPAEVNGQAPFSRATTTVAPVTPSPSDTQPPATTAPAGVTTEVAASSGSSSSSRLRGSSVDSPVDSQAAQNEAGMLVSSPTIAPVATDSELPPVIRQVTTRADNSDHATSPVLLVLLVLACSCMVVLVALAVVVKRRRRQERASAAKHDVGHVSELPPLVVRQNSYEELATPSKRADIAVL